jgi:hypothetical protein
MYSVSFSIVQSFSFNDSHNIQIFVQIIILFDDLINNFLLIECVNVIHVYVMCYYDVCVTHRRRRWCNVV